MHDHLPPDILLDEWLNHIRTSHDSIIDYNLERIQHVAQHLDLLQPKIPVITVTGTNGKGSTVHTIEAILKAASYHVGVFTSPYLEVFNEQIRINGHKVTDNQLITAFKIINDACLNVTTSLTEFEFLTLAALLIFKQHPLDIIILEVGLGGGNDAVAIIVPDITVVTSIALDHEDYLGHTIDTIATSEAALLAPGKIGISGVTQPPQPLSECAEKNNTLLLCLGRDFYIEKKSDYWTFSYNDVIYDNLPYPKVLIQNAALAVQALLSCHIPFSQEQLQTGLNTISIQGRLQLIKGNPSCLIDVSHNIEGVTQLATYLHSLPYQKIIAVFSAFSDKPIGELIVLIDPFIDHWFIAPIDHPRAASMEQLLTAFNEKGLHISKITTTDNLKDAFQAALNFSTPDDLMLTFGSFFVAREALLHSYRL